MENRQHCMSSTDRCRDPSFPVEELWVDRQTGLVMQWNVERQSFHAKASDVDFPLIAADAFSLPPPSGAQDQAHPAALFAVHAHRRRRTRRGRATEPVGDRRWDPAGDPDTRRSPAAYDWRWQVPPVIALLMFDDFTNLRVACNPSDVAAARQSISVSARSRCPSESTSRASRLTWPPRPMLST